jgi:uncharacterized DUF497 family protein
MHDNVIYLDRYIWNRFKNDSNKRKHKIGFETAVEVFNDPMAITVFDEENSTDTEDRFKIIGYIPIRPSFVTVSFTPRLELTRIFSARKAGEEEKEAYIENAERYNDR